MGSTVVGRLAGKIVPQLIDREEIVLQATGEPRLRQWHLNCERRMLETTQCERVSIFLWQKR